MGLNLPSRKLVSQQDASLNKRPDVPRSQFINRFGLKTAFNAGLLYPILVNEVLPGDHLKYKVNAGIRLDTPFFPIMDSQRIDIHFFYCPTRVLWANFERMLGAQDDPDSSIDYTVPILGSMPANGPAVGSLADYMGIPTVGQITAGLGDDLIINGLPFRMYNRTWNAWFRAQTLQDSVNTSTGDSAVAYNNYTLLPRNKSHDYFTMALPEPQRGTAPTIPVGGLAPIVGIGFDTAATGGTSTDVKETDTVATVNYPIGRTAAVFKATSTLANAAPEIYANLAEATGVSVNQFRQAIMVQTLLEQSARGGTRYVEQMMSIWGVRPPDYRVQRPEYIGGGSFNLVITPVANTTNEGDPLGTLGGAGTANGVVEASYAATEHGYIMGLISVKTELSYQQGLHPLWSRRTRYDFPVPAFSGLGEQAVLRKEIYLTGNATDDDTVFGYVPRYEEYRTEVSRVTGIMRSTAAGTLDAWHFAQDFATAPTLGDTFIKDSPDMARVLAEGELASGQQYKADIVFDRVATRPLPAWGIPATLGRF